MIDKSKTDALMGELWFLLKRMKADLQKNGYIFDFPQQTLEPKWSKTDLALAEMKQYFGSFPYAVESFFLVIGSVNFCGQTDVFEELDYPDPLQLGPFDYQVRCFNDFRSNEKEKQWYLEGFGGFPLLMSADYYHKENVSGGSEYYIRMPASNDDPILEESPWNRSFLSYLSLVLEYGGFPGYSTGKLELPPYYNDPTIIRESQKLSLRFEELAQLCK